MIDTRKTKGMLVKLRKKEMLENNMKVFGNVSIGIHGRELPKFQHNMPEWWKNKSGYNSKPKESSLLKLKQSVKYWAKQDNILLSDMLYTQPPPDHFKLTYVKK